MGSSSSSDNGNDKTVTIHNGHKAPANSLTASMAKDAKADKDAKANDAPKSGDWDETRGRTLGYNDFLPGGMYGPMAGEVKGAPVDYGARRDAWNAKNPQISDARAAHARSQNLDRTFNGGHMQTLENGLTVERMSADHSKAMTVASAAAVGKLGELPAAPTKSEETVDAMGDKPEAKAPIAASLTEPSKAQVAKAGALVSGLTKDVTLPEDPTKASVQSPYTTSREQAEKNRARIAKGVEERAKAAEKEEETLRQGALDGLVSQVQAATNNARRSQEFHPAYGLTDSGRKAAIAKEHHPGYGYTNRGREMLGELKQDIKQSLAPRTGFTSRGQQLVDLYNTLPGTSVVTQESGAKASRMTGQSKRNRDRVLFGPDYRAVQKAQKEEEARVTKQVEAARHRRGRNVEVNPYLGAIWQGEVRPTLVAGMATVKAMKGEPFSKDFLAHQARIANVSVPSKYANTPAANVVRNAGWAFSKAVGSVPGVMESAGKRDISLAQQGASPSQRQNAAIARGVVDLVTNTALKSNVGTIQEVMKNSGRHLPSFSYDLLESGIVSAKNYVLDALLEHNDKRGEEKK